MDWSTWEKIALKVLAAIIAALSPELRALLEDMVRELYRRARATDSPLDDKLVELLAAVLGVELDPRPVSTF